MKKTCSLIALTTLGLLALTPSARAQIYTIDNSPGLFTPSFRDGTNNDLGNTTWWGWSPGTFGAPLSAVSNPPVTMGVGGVDGSLGQVGTNAIVSGSSNIYTASFMNETLSLNIATVGVVGTGFTTIIIQSRTAFGGYNAGDPGIFSDINGFAPTVVTANNALGRGQVWAKYELLGNASAYSVNWTMPGMTSIAEITVDTQWSSSGFSPDVAVIPEPQTWVLAGIGMAFWICMMRRRRGMAQSKYI